MKKLTLTRTEQIANWRYGQEFTAYGEPVAVYADVSKEVREKAKTMDDESYPIDKCTGEGPSVESAIGAVGRGSGDHDAIRRHIINSAQELGCGDLIPDNWNDDGSEKDTAAAGALPPEEEEGEPENDEAADDAVAQAINAAIEAQEADGDLDPSDERVLTLLKQAAAAQAEDSNEEAEEPEEEPGDKAEASLAVDSNSVCSTPNCGHQASVHETTENGKNQGGCLEAGCTCEGFTSNESVNDDPGSGGGKSDMEIVLEPDAPAPVAEPVATDAPKTKPPEVEGGEVMGPAFSIPVAIVEGEPTGDGRAIACGALDWRVPPLPLMGMATSSHDPTGMSPNAPAVICGRIDELTRGPGELPNTEVISAKGFFLGNEDGEYWAKLAEEMGRIGVSADVAVDESEQEIGEIDADGFPMSMTETLTKGTIMAVTACPQPAFEGAYLVLGDGSAEPTPIPQESETASGAIPPHFMSYEACEPCQYELDVLEASGGPVAPPKSWFANPEFVEGDGRLVEILDKRSQRAIGGKYACPLTVTEDGRVFGHLAPWGVCHSGFPNTCVTAPHSKVDYAHFKRSQSVVTAEGDEVRVGVLTMDAGHAPTRGIRAGAAMAHYDNTAWAIADVNIGEDEYGIWFAGALRPDATPEQVRKLRAASVSGDWRNMGSGLELVAALAVNQPGYPLAQVASGHPEAMVATGATVMHRLKHPAEDEPAPDLLTTALMPLLRDARARATAQFDRTRALRRLARIR